MDTDLIMLEIGKLNETRGEVSVEWRIDTESELYPMRAFLSSPFFHFSDACWSLKICPGLDRCGRKESYLGLFREDFGPAKTVSFTLSYWKENIMEEVFCSRDYAFSKTDAVSMLWELKKYHEATVNSSTVSPTRSPCVSPNTISALGCVSTEQLTGSTIPTPSGTLIVICTIKSEGELPLEVSLFRRLWSASRSLRKILSKEESADVTLKLKSREVPAHRLILESRFPDFVSKFDNEMEGNKVGQLNIEDSDENAFDIVLSYVYTGEPEELSSENVWAVYRIACKCSLQELKKLCLTFVEKNLSVNGVCDVIAKADGYGEKELKKRAKEFFAKNSSQIRQTYEWRSFKAENLRLLPELIEYMMQ